MKYKNYYKIAVSLIVLSINVISCKPSVTFEEPQPKNEKNLSSFPKKLQGDYLSLSDSSKITIEAKTILRIYDFNQTFHPNQLDNTMRISGDTLIDIDTNERTVLKRNGDSLISHFHSVDTLFQISEEAILKKFRGYYFLNFSYHEDGWEVKKLQYKKEKLTISSISQKEDIENLKSIMESDQDTVIPYKFKASKRQFKEFVKNDGFTDSEIFVRSK